MSRVALLITVAFVLWLAFPCPSQAGKLKNAPEKKKVCVGKDGNSYKVGQGYDDNEGKTCIRYKCIKRKKNKLIMKKAKCEPMKRTATCGFNDDKELGGSNVRSPVNLDSGYTWRGGKIPYYFQNSVQSRDRNAIRQVMQQIHGQTCFRFEEMYYEPSGHHLMISVGWPRCSSYGFKAEVGMLSNTKMRFYSRDQVWCNPGALILHELMHVLGVMHTQKRIDRDEYITVDTNNILDEAKAQYEPCRNCWMKHGHPYECQSLMHYGTTTGGNRRGPTMTAKNPWTCRLSKYANKVPTKADWDLLRTIASDVCTQGPSGCSFTDNYSYCPYLKQYCSYNSWVKSVCRKTCNC